MESTLREELEDFIIKFNCTNEPSQEHKERVFREITNFRLWVLNQKEQNSFRYVHIYLFLLFMAYIEKTTYFLDIKF